MTGAPLSKPVIRAQSSPNLLPEERFLLAVAKLCPSSRDFEIATELAGADGFSWNSAFALAVDHRVHPLLGYNLCGAFRVGALLDPAREKSLRKAQAEATWRRSLYGRTIAPVFSSLTAKGIPVAMMKGAALVETLYPPGARLLNDFDVLIRKEAYPVVASAFCDAGFQKRFRDGHTEASELSTYHQIGFVKRSGRSALSLDLHWMMYPANRLFFIDTASLFARAQPATLQGVPVLTLSSEDTFLHYATQLLNDGFRTGYQRLSDIHALAHGGLAWDLLRRISFESRAEGAVYLALMLASMLGARIPPSIFRELESSSGGCGAASEFLADPRWPFGRLAVAHAAQPVLIARLCSRPASGRQPLLRGAYNVARRQGETILNSCLASVRLACKSGLWSAAFAAMQVAHRVRAHRLALSLTERLWKRSLPDHRGV